MFGTRDELIQAARAVCGGFRLQRDFSAGTVGAAVRTVTGHVYTGVCIDLASGLGFCAEAAAIADMVKHRETHITTAVAVAGHRIVPPCGRCREMMAQVDARNLDCRVMVAEDLDVPLRDLLPHPWLGAAERTDLPRPDYGNAVWCRSPEMGLATAGAMTYRFATDADLDLLAEWNHQLIRDEGHRNPMTVPELRNRMRGWLAGDYKAVVFLTDRGPVAYALYRDNPDEVYLRQFFVRRERRRIGFGRQAITLLREHIWPSGKRLTLEVLCQNTTGLRFWRTLGYQDYCLTLEILSGAQCASSMVDDRPAVPTDGNA